MARAARKMDETVMGCRRLGWSVEKIWKHTHVGKGRIAANRDGHPLNHRNGRRETLFREVISFIETHYLIDAEIDDGELARMLDDRFHFDGVRCDDRWFAKYGTS
jgi:hypothetical protein